jgi:uncharacterized caspase-like protein
MQNCKRALQVVMGVALVATTACATTTTVDTGRYTRNAAAPPSTRHACKPDAPPQKWAVVIGINFYEDDRISDLGGAVNDAWTFYHYLANPNGGGVDAYRLRLLLNDEATRTNVEGALGGFLSNACPQDHIIIYFAGHGSPEPGRPEDAFLLVHDTDVDNIVGSAISMGRLPDFLEWRAGRTGNLLMLIDACHSGNIQFPGSRGGVLDESIRLEQATAVVKSLDKLVEKDGWGAISATAPNQLAGESTQTCKLGNTNYSGGIFTCYLVAGMTGKADLNQDGVVVLEELFAYVQREVADFTFGSQKPQLSGTLNPALPISTSKSGLEIPRVPRRYLIEEKPHALRPFVWLGAGLTAATLVTGGVLNLVANVQAGDSNSTTPSDRTRAEFAADRRDFDDTRGLANVTYLSGAALALVTTGLLLLDEYGAPEDIDDVYSDEPWLRIGIQGAALNLRW